MDKTVETEWEWPCDKHRAHGAHENPIVNGEMVISGNTICPGVKAHPLTQIGKGELKPKLSK